MFFIRPTIFRIFRYPSSSKRLFATVTSADQQEAIQQLCRKYAVKELAPIAGQLDIDDKFPTKQIQQLGELGLMGMTAGKQFNGSDLDILTVSLAVEELSRGCAATGSIVSIHNILYVDLLNTHGSEEQKLKFLKPYTKGTPGAFALSEPEAGSDVVNIDTVYKKSGNSYIINGLKSWVTSGLEAECAVVFATSDKSLKHKGISAFVVPLDTPGVVRGKREDKLGIRASSTCELSLCNVNIPLENILGAEGDGFKIAMAQLNKARIGIASQALGIAQASLDSALCYANTRKAFDKTLLDLQAVQIRLAKMAARIESARLLVRKAATMCRDNENFIKNSAIAKLMASETATFAAHQCIQIMGGMGYIKNMPAERYYRDARITEIYGGVSDIQMLIIADQLIREIR